MARKLQYPHKITVRLSDQGKENLTARAGIMQLEESVAARIILEHDLSGTPINQGGSDGNIQQKDNDES